MRRFYAQLCRNMPHHRTRSTARRTCDSRGLYPTYIGEAHRGLGIAYCTLLVINDDHGRGRCGCIENLDLGMRAVESLEISYDELITKRAKLTMHRGEEHA